MEDQVQAQELVFSTPPKPMVRHLDKLLAKARKCDVFFKTEDRRDLFLVHSGSSNAVYEVRVKNDGAECTCDWGFYRPEADRRSVCAHTLAVYLFLLGEEYRMSAWTDEERAKRQKKQRWYVGEGVTLTFSRKRSQKKGV